MKLAAPALVGAGVLAAETLDATDDDGVLTPVEARDAILLATEAALVLTAPAVLAVTETGLAEVPVAPEVAGTVASAEGGMERVTPAERQN